MGVLPNTRKVCFPQSDSDDHGIVESTDSDSDVPPPPAPARQRRRSGCSTLPVSPAAIRRKFCGHKLTLKKGRRSQHRYENERMLFSSVDMDSEEPPEGWDIAQESRSHFTELLMASNRDLLEHFVSNMENPERDWPSSNNLNHKSKKSGEKKDPEEAYLGIHANVRAAMKKHLPWGMLEGLDKEICDFFESDPEAVFISQGLSSYERLLAHACSMYYQLRSQSLDVEGIRTLTIENPSSTFKPIDPSLPNYLRMRSSHTL